MVLVVADEPWVRNEVHASLTNPDITLVDHSDPTTVTEVLAGDDFAAVIVDLQVGSMGGMAVTRAVREAESLVELGPIPVIMLLDRSADTFLAGRAGAAAWVLKPIASHDLNEALELATGTAVPTE